MQRGLAEDNAERSAVDIDPLRPSPVIGPDPDHPRIAHLVPHGEQWTETERKFVVRADSGLLKAV